MPRMYGREIVVSIIKLKGFFEQGDNIIFISGLRVSFKFEKSLGKNPNSGEVKIYNLAESSRAELQTKPLYIRLDAGYDGTLSRIFEGDIVSVDPAHEGNEWVTTIKVGDGQRAFRNARVNRSYREGVKARDAIRELARSMGLKVPDAINRREFLKEYSAGLSLYGSAHKELTRLLDSFGISWSVQDGSLLILAPNDVLPDEAIVISGETGMIGSPELGDPKNKGGKPKLKTKTLLDARIKPGGRISMRAEKVQGLYRVEKAKYLGDTHDKDWTIEVEAIAA